MRRPVFWIALFVILRFSGSAAAQSPELTIGYQALHVPDNWINAGLNVDVAAHAADTMMIVGEFGLAHQGSSGNDPVKSIAYHVGGGPRWSWAGPQATTFVQILAGAEVTSAEIPTPGGTFEDSDTAFMLQAGGGVFVPVGSRWGVVAQADYRPVFFSEETDNQFRIVLGARFLLGR